jgi:hypothetical protein
MKTAVTFTVVEDALDERGRLLEHLGDLLGAAPVLRVEQRLLQKETDLRGCELFSRLASRSHSFLQRLAPTGSLAAFF